MRSTAWDRLVHLAIVPVLLRYAPLNRVLTEDAPLHAKAQQPEPALRGVDVRDRRQRQAASGSAVLPNQCEIRCGTVKPSTLSVVREPGDEEDMPQCDVDAACSLTVGLYSR